MRRNILNVLCVIGTPLFGSTLAPRRSIVFRNSAGTWSRAPGKQFGVLDRWRDRHTRPARWSDTLRIRPVRWRKWNRIRIDLARLADPICLSRNVLMHHWVILKYRPSIRRSQMSSIFTNQPVDSKGSVVICKAIKGSRYSMRGYNVIFTTTKLFMGYRLTEKLWHLCIYVYRLIICKDMGNQKFNKSLRMFYIHEYFNNPPSVIRFFYMILHAVNVYDSTKLYSVCIIFTIHSKYATPPCDEVKSAVDKHMSPWTALSRYP